MGNFLFTVDTLKVVDYGFFEDFAFGLASMRGWRLRMEDAHLVTTPPYLPVPPGLENDIKGLFGVFDGHGGAHVARFVANNLLQLLEESPSYMSGNLEEGLREAILAVDLRLFEGRESDEAELQRLSEQQTESSVVDPAVLSVNDCGPQADKMSSDQEQRLFVNVANGSVKNCRRCHCQEKLMVLPFDGLSEQSSSVECIKGSGTARCSQDVIKVVGRRRLASRRVYSDSDMLKNYQLGNAGEKASFDLPPRYPTVVAPGVDDLSNVTAPLAGYEAKWKARFLRWRRRVSKSSGDKLQSPVAVPEGDDKAACVLQGHNPEKGGFFRILNLGNREDKRRSDQPLGCPSAQTAGCTALVVLMTATRIIVANVGDSRAILSRAGIAHNLSRDHKPELPEEKKRIIKAEGTVECGRVNGNLNLSRALGDLKHKQDPRFPLEEQVICGAPEITSVDLVNDDEFLTLCCDGLLEFFSSQAIVNYITNRLQGDHVDDGFDSLIPDCTKHIPQTMAPVGVPERTSDVLSALMNTVVSPNPSVFGLGCDNMTSILIDLKPFRYCSCGCHPWCRQTKAVSLPEVPCPSRLTNSEVLTAGAGIVRLSTIVGIHHAETRIAHQEDKRFPPLELPTPREHNSATSRSFRLRRTLRPRRTMTT